MLKDVLENKFELYKLVASSDGSKLSLVNTKTGHLVNSPKAITSYIYNKQLIKNRMKYGYSASESFKFLEKKHELRLKAIDSTTYNHFYRVGSHIENQLIHKLTSFKEIWVAFWIVNNMNPKTNKIHCTYDEINQHIHTSRNTIYKTLKAMRNMNLIKTHSGAIFVNPILSMKGSSARYIVIYSDYYGTTKPWWKHINDNDEYTLKQQKHSKAKKS